MSKGDHNSLYVDTGLLRDHISRLQEERKLASRLYENIEVMKAMADPADVHRYNAVLRDIEQMIEYFNKMASQLAYIADEAVQLSHELQGLAQDGTDLSRRITAEKFVL